VIDLAHVALAAGAAAAVAVGATVAVERLGGRVGGVVATVPTTIVPATAAIWLSLPQDEGSLDAYRVSMWLVPIGMLLCGLVLATWRLLPQRLPKSFGDLKKMWCTLAASVCVWAAGSTAIVSLEDAVDPSQATAAVWGAVGWCLTLALGLVLWRISHHAPRGRHRVGPGALALRGVAAGAAIAVSTAIAQSGWPVASGIASTFPAIFLTTMVATWIAQGSAVPTGATGPMVLGSLSVGAYSVASAQVYPATGLALGIPLCWTAAVLTTTLPVHVWLMLSSRRGAPGAEAPNVAPGAAREPTSSGIWTRPNS
jgi:hypothetical protein